MECLSGGLLVGSVLVGGSEKSAPSFLLLTCGSLNMKTKLEAIELGSSPTPTPKDTWVVGGEGLSVTDNMGSYLAFTSHRVTV